MAYSTQAEVEAVIPARFLTDALDDDESGTADTGLLTAIFGVVDTEIDGMISPSVTVPITGTVPQTIRTAATVLTCETIYLRRGITGDANPWTERAKDTRDLLERIGRGEVSIDASGITAASFDDSRDLVFDTSDDA